MRLWVILIVGLLQGPLLAQPQTAVALYDIGLQQATDGSYRSALKSFDQALGLDRQYAAVYLARSAVYVALGQKAQGLADLNHVIRLEPTNPAAFLGRGAIKVALGDTKGGITDLNRALEIQPDYAEAYLSRGAVRLQRDDTKGAQRDLDRALDLFTQSGDLGGYQEAQNLLRQLQAPKVIKAKVQPRLDESAERVAHLLDTYILQLKSPNLVPKEVQALAEKASPYLLQIPAQHPKVQAYKQALSLALNQAQSNERTQLEFTALQKQEDNRIALELERERAKREAENRLITIVNGPILYPQQTIRVCSGGLCAYYPLRSRVKATNVNLCTPGKC